MSREAAGGRTPVEQQGETPELAAVRRLAPEIRARAREYETARRVPADLARRLNEDGLFRLWIPTSLGGRELPPVDTVPIIEELAQADASVAWCVMIAITTSAFGGFMPTRGAEEVFCSDPYSIAAGAFAPTGKAIAVDGGYRVTGHWQWGSGIQNCQWAIGSCVISRSDHSPAVAHTKPEIRQVFLSADQIDILDTWDVSGLRGTGSHDFQATDVFVPEHRSFTVVAPVVDTPLYRCTWFATGAALTSAVPLGIARRAIDEFTALARAKTPTYDPRSLADSPRVHAWIGEAEAAVRSARAFLFDALAALWRQAHTGPVTLALRRDLRLAAVNAAAQSAKAVDLMYTAAGGSAVHTSHPLQRCFRDVHVITQHVLVNPTVFEYCGRFFVRDDGPELPFF